MLCERCGAGHSAAACCVSLPRVDHWCLLPFLPLDYATLTSREHLQRCLAECAAVNHGMLTCLQRFLSSKDIAFVRQLCAVCGEPGASTDRDGDAAEFLAHLLGTLRHDFPLLGDLFTVSVSAGAACGTCGTRTVLVVPGGCGNGAAPLSLPEAYRAAAENACTAMFHVCAYSGSLSQRVPCALSHSSLPGKPHCGAQRGSGTVSGRPAAHPRYGGSAHILRQHAFRADGRHRLQRWPLHCAFAPYPCLYSFPTNPAVLPSPLVLLSARDGSSLTTHIRSTRTLPLTAHRPHQPRSSSSASVCFLNHTHVLLLLLRSPSRFTHRPS